MKREDYVDRGLRYARAVVAGEIVACAWVKAACQRQLNDLKRTDLRWHFDRERANHVCRFIELLPHIKGEWARQRRTILLEDWQCFILTTVFGWVDDAGLRRFKVVYTEVPRKNAKSTLSSGVALYMLTADGEPGAEVYSAATTRDQAKIVWADAAAMVQRSPGMRDRFGVEAGANAIYVEHSSSTFRPLSRDQGGNHDGYSVHCGIVDEVHAHKTRELWDVLDTATGARSQPLLWAITTAGFNRAGICYELRDYVCRILRGAQDDDEFFGIIYTIDDGDDWTDPRVWAKANPNWGISVDPADIERKARRAMEQAAAQNNFLTKHLNVWVNASSAWMNMQAWDACADTDLDEREFLGEDCWGGLDLASKKDLAPFARIYKRVVDGVDHYYAFVTSFLPEARAEGAENAHYAGWAHDGRIKLTPGNITDFAYIEDEIREHAGRVRMQKVGFDPWQATYLATNLMAEGLPMVEYRQIVANMSEPMKQLEALVLSGRFHFDGDPVLTWAISNVVAKLDKKENIYPDKEFPENKIDPVVAVITALGLAMEGEAENSVSDIFMVL